MHRSGCYASPGGHSSTQSVGIHVRLQVIGRQRSLLPVHRLDCGTEGVLLLAKTAVAARKFHRIFSAASNDHSQAGINKVYRALSAAPAPLGTYEDWLLIDQGGGKGPRHTQVGSRGMAGAVRAQLTVTQVRCAACWLPCLVPPH